MSGEIPKFALTFSLHYLLGSPAPLLNLKQHNILFCRPPSDLEHFAKGIKVVEKDVCISEEGGAVPFDPRLVKG